MPAVNFKPQAEYPKNYKLQTENCKLETSRKHSFYSFTFAVDFLSMAAKEMNNRQAYFNYQIEDKYLAGIVDRRAHV